ncbi:PepSY domain-containing protein [Skermanella pratensis]|uniref:PepSY domain-containing protein n=1 Tax=Skermanella pratensis TaxID=2233999 RepID=UPI001787E6D7|nr:PepSY domain-containing protein [Skermanella pratensis]
MRTLIIPVVAMALSVSPVALAQSQKSGGQQDMTRSYKEVENSLKQAGIQDVQVLNASYLVSAVTKQGEQVTFVVDPAAAMGASGSGGGSQGGSSGQQQSGNQQPGNQQGASAQAGGGQQAPLASQQQVRTALTKAGFQNVQILDATYLARGTTQNGDQITMMIDPSATTGSSEASSGNSSPQQSGGQKQ